MENCEMVQRQGQNGENGGIYKRALACKISSNLLSLILLLFFLSSISNSTFFKFEAPRRDFVEEIRGLLIGIGGSSSPLKIPIEAKVSSFLFFYFSFYIGCKFQFFSSFFKALNLRYGGFSLERSHGFPKRWLCRKPMSKSL